MFMLMNIQKLSAVMCIVQNSHAVCCTYEPSEVD
jgi:hypothetical protein